MKVTRKELMEAMENAKARLLREMDFGDDYLTTMPKTILRQR